jgi:hypothetical protein
VKYHYIPGFKSYHLDYNGTIRWGDPPGIQNMILARNCLLYLHTGDEFLTYDFITESVVSRVDIMPNIPDGYTYDGFKRGLASEFTMKGSYYSPSVLTAESIWWSYYERRQYNTTTGSFLGGYNGFFSYDGYEVKFYAPPQDQPALAIYADTAGFAVIGNDIIYGTDFGISKLTIGS